MSMKLLPGKVAGKLDRPASAARLATVAFVLAGAAIALAETDRIIGRSMVVGENATLRSVIGVSALGEQGAWESWASSDVYKVVANLIGWHTFFDLVFVATYGYLLYHLIAGTTRRPAAEGGTLNRIACYALMALIAIEVVEAVALSVNAVLLRVGVTPWGWLVAGVATAKWVAVTALALSLLRDKNFRKNAWHATVRAARAIWVQRLSVLVVVSLTVLTLLPLPGALDQVPDAVRQWIESPVSGLVALVGYAALAFGIWRLGRRRTSLVFELWVQNSPGTDGQRFRRPAPIAIWFVGPAAVALVAWLLRRNEYSNLVDPASAALFVVLPSTLALCSLAIRGWSAAALVQPADDTQITQVSTTHEASPTLDLPPTSHPEILPAPVTLELTRAEAGSSRENRGNLAAYKYKIGRWLLSMWASVGRLLTRLRGIARPNTPNVISSIPQSSPLVGNSELSSSTETTPNRTRSRGLGHAWFPTESKAAIQVLLGLVVLTVATFWIAKDDSNIEWFIGVPIGTVLAGTIVGAWFRNRTFWAYKPKQDQSGELLRIVRDVETTGSLAAVSIIAIAGLALVRAFSAPLVLTLNVEHSSVFKYDFWGVLVAVVVGWGLVYRAGTLASKTSTGTLVESHLARTPPTEGGPSDRLIRWGLLIISVLALAALALAPAAVSGTLGVVGTLLLALGGWTVLGGLFITYLQQRQPLEVFRLFRMEANPVLTLVVVLLISVGLVGGDPDLHAIRTESTAPPVDRQDLKSAFDEWLSESAECDRVSTAPAAPFSIRPMVMVAASGGGIRAAVWTAQAMSRVAEMNSCGAQAVFASSGVSGGSVGLTMSKLIGTPGELRSASRALANPDSLAVAVGGTAFGDVIASATGIRAQAGSWSPLPREYRWRDRAGLMEESWQKSVPALQEEYEITPSRLPADGIRSRVGELILNSAVAGPNCRLLVSQIDLTNVAGEGNGCRDSSAELASTWDMHELLGSCFPQMDWATAAMLSARFPYVTPTGRLVPEEGKDCTEIAQSLQFIDGGYAEGSGLGTLADLAPAVAAMVREHNIEVLTGSATDAAPSSIIVPVVVYLDDEPSPERGNGEISATSEALAPRAGSGTNSELTSIDAWAQRITLAYDSSCPTRTKQGTFTFDHLERDETAERPEGAEQRCTDLLFREVRELPNSRFYPPDGVKNPDQALRNIMQSVNGSMITVSPPRGPSVEVPLGWTLSEASIDNLSTVLGHREPEANTDAFTCRDTPRSDGMVVLTIVLCAQSY